ncbi:hypothetical protein ACHAWF_006925 [Thalassiosira exigua]
MRSIQMNTQPKPPKLGPKPTLLSRRQVDALYSLLEAVTNGLKQLGVPYILTGGSLLGAIRQHSILFCDDYVDLAILSDGEEMYERVKSQLPDLLGREYLYSVRPWEGGDKVRMKACSNVFLDVFVIRKYQHMGELREVIGTKKNGEKQPDEYVRRIVDDIRNALHSQGEVSEMNNDLELPFPVWHFSTRKAIELWPKEVYRGCELYPTIHHLKMGPVTGLSGPHAPAFLLKRAFGQDCFEVYYQSASHGKKCTINDGGSATSSSPCQHVQSKLPALVSAGGQWSQSVKTALSDEHYLPMQPESKAKRRHTLHNKHNLFDYLELQSEEELLALRKAGVLPDILTCDDSINSQRPGKVTSLVEEPKRKTVYMDGVFDLFHVGHLNAIQQCAALGNRVVIGVTGDDDASGYKRCPIIPQSERAAIVSSLAMVNDVVCPCTLVVTQEFMDEWGIDLVVHGYADPSDKDRQREFFQVAMDEGKFKEIEYYSQLSTSDIISRIQEEKTTKDLCVKIPKQKNGVNPQWFGAALSSATSKSSYIPYDPFPLELRHVIEKQQRKATEKRQDALNAIRCATGSSLFEEALAEFNKSYSREGSFHFDTQQIQLREKFLQSCGLSSDFDLSTLHKHCAKANFKDEMLFAFARDRHHFLEVYDHFVRSVCCPFVASMSDEPMDEVYYQSFPCVRVVRPGDFSIGPHADCSYGHHPCSINFYIPLTQIEGSASLFLESRPGSEDWHPIEGNYGFVKHFAGALCTHWTPENNCNFTRVSLDFRIIPSKKLFGVLKCGGNQLGGVRDVYREKSGYYRRCCLRKTGSESQWKTERPIPDSVPDARFGFPWTKFKP